MHRLPLCLVLLATVAVAEPARLGLFVAGGAISGSQGSGPALLTGGRLGLGHVALSFDFGYGLLATGPGFQDRWWLMPAVAGVFDFGRFEIDLGLGIGAATASAFESDDDLLHDRNSWELQLEPAVRLHARVGLRLTPRLELFGRLDLATLVVNPNTLWLNLWFGAQFDLL